MFIRKIKLFRITIFSIAIIALMVSGCSLGNQAVNQTPTPAPNGQQTNLDQVSSELEMMQSLWESQNLDSYRFQFQWQCFCLPDYLETVWVTVEDGAITSVEAVDPNFEGTIPDMSEFRTISGLFDLIRDGIENQAYEIRVTYNDTFGYPASAYIDYDFNMADEERGFEILEFESQLPEATETTPPAGSDPAIDISPLSGSPGTEVQVMVSGFPANIPVDIGIGRVNSEYDVITSANTDQDGNLERTIVIPNFVTPDDEWVIVAAAVNQNITAVSDIFDVTQSEDPDNLFTSTNIYFIAVGDNGQSGKKIGCDDSVVPVEIDIEPTAAPLTAGLTRMLELDSQYYGQSGLYNVFYQSDLEIDSIEIVNGEAIIRLSGNLLLGGVCDDPRVEAQIAETALQFSTVSEVTIYINGELWE